MADEEHSPRLFSFGGKRYIAREQTSSAKITTDRITGNMPAKEFLTAREVARYLRVNQYTVYRLVTQKKLPAVKVGSQWRFRRSMLDRWLENQLTLPREQ
jgi:excisionase family DNA binding protein